MIRKEVISYSQLFMLIVSFEIGSAVVVDIGSEAKQDAWLAVLGGSILGLLLLIVYCHMLFKTKHKHLYDTFTTLLGRKIGIILAFLYVLYFLYVAARVLRDFGELVNTVIFPNTPIEVISILFLLVVMYYLVLGLEVTSRSVGIFMPYFILFLFLIILFLFVNQSMETDRLRPVLAEGMSPVLKAIFPSVLTFPFGEVIVFTTFVAAMNERKETMKVCVVAMLFSGIMLALFTVIKLSVLGVELADRAAFPLLSAIRTISLANFLERLDALVVFVMMLGIFVKVTIFLYGALKGLEFISGQSYHLFVIPVTAVAGFQSILIANNYAEHLEEGLKFVPYYFHLPFQIFIPIGLLVGLWLREKISKKGGSQV
ncbi:endospore germination permease [Bacillus sp. CGMCC 1.16541]|uniref:GerAB/ArcD/ProY family transporter n=1 Tax=Bacillus sp. CGMCC 1.16541 TaxID=2185143 RepID=UPI000D73A175|nr:endospore germination permease [Bacillus sp. CGMCC 1.16541]